MVTLANLPTHFDRFIKAGIYLRNWSRRTPGTYRQGLNAFQRALASTDGAESLAKSHLEHFVIDMRQRGLRASACNVYLRTFNSFLSWLHEEGLTDTRLRMKLLQDHRDPLVIFSDTDIRRLLAYRPSSYYRARLCTLIALLLDTGVRIDEALGLQVGDVNLDELSITVIGKGNRKRRVPYSPELRKSLWRHLQARQRRAVHGTFIFCAASGNRMSYRNVYRGIGELCTELGIKGPRLSPHTFRHYFAVSYIRHGGDLYRLSRILGHTSVKTTEIYLRSMGFDALSERHQQLSPLSHLGSCR